MFKFSFKSLKNIECGYAPDSNAGNILVEIIVRDQICLIFQAQYMNFDQIGGTLCLHDWNSARSSFIRGSLISLMVV